jgi:hypothetical protein
MLIPKSNNEQIACISCSVFSGFGILDIAYDDDTGDQTHQGNGDHAHVSGAGQIRDCNLSPAQLKNSLTNKNIPYKRCLCKSRWGRHAYQPSTRTKNQKNLLYRVKDIFSLCTKIQLNTCPMQTRVKVSIIDPYFPLHIFRNIATLANETDGLLQLRTVG